VSESSPARAPSFAVVVTRIAGAPVAIDASALVRLEDGATPARERLIDVKRVLGEGPTHDAGAQRRGCFRVGDGEVALSLHEALEMRVIERRALHALPPLLRRLEARGVIAFVLVDDVPHALVDVPALARAHDAARDAAPLAERGSP
jgi:hypothetical protein